MENATFVLVHGAWHGSWCYRRVVGHLNERGARAYPLTLTGLADKSHMLSPSIGLQTHVDDVVNFVKWEGLEKVVLCGHSYGGMVITGASEVLRDRLGALVYLDAFVPEAGKSALEYTEPGTRTRLEAVAAGNGSPYLPPISAETFLVNENDRAWVDAQCTPQPYRTVIDPVGSTTFRDQLKTKYYVRATKWASPMMDEFAAYCRARPDWRVVNMPYGHDLMLDAPEDVAKLLLEAAAAIDGVSAG
ncbi:alpha/beta fold hydrolase [Bradyrhizobium liaoningense]|uniref:alpha/beta fold hydrolase n=1 Tax=Bradyrhizobium liaoningense TaxID=43992 RepID=UPI001BA868D7|nr:alpha/beta hydrolase [Bradyrhizobium liaoningense]MBR0854504.1 alpha/beta hydrolase [Bradyrhizobium liaoningense]